MGFTPLDKNSAFVRSARQERTPAARKRAHPTATQRSLFDESESTAVVDEALDDEEEFVQVEYRALATWDDLPEEERARKIAERDRLWAAMAEYDKIHLGYLAKVNTLDEVYGAMNAVRAAWDDPFPAVVPESPPFKFGGSDGDSSGEPIRTAGSESGSGV